MGIVYNLLTSKYTLAIRLSTGKILPEAESGRTILEKKEPLYLIEEFLHAVADDNRLMAVLQVIAKAAPLVRSFFLGGVGGVTVARRKRRKMTVAIVVIYSGINY